jgi:DNA-binding XRE family transcriptional regulator
MTRPPLSPSRILAWADHHRQATGRWPSVKSGRVLGARGENWKGVDNALRYGLRGLDGGSSLALFLARHRRARNKTNLPALTPRQILAWADAHHRRTGAWPTEDSGPVGGVPGENWRALDRALNAGHRGLPGGDSLGRLLARRRGARNHTNIPRLSVGKILAWADAHHGRTGQWPDHLSGPIQDAPGETWAAVESALQRGCRGLPGGSSLYRLLKEHRHIPGPQPPVRPSLRRGEGRGRPRVCIKFPAEVLRRYQARELDTRAIARLCGVCHPVALRELRRAGVPVPGLGRPRGTRPAWHAEILRRYRRGQSLACIAVALGLRPGRVAGILKRYGVVRRPAGPDLFRQGLSEEERQRLATRLRELRQATGLSQDGLAARSKVSQETISGLETARRCPTRRTMVRLARALRVPLQDLLVSAGR